ncbi:MAG: glutamate racemase [Pseudomonadota bacterium]
MDENSPIGVFDSGVGGLSVLRWIRDRLPAEDLVYVADSNNAPYGSKSPEFVRQRAMFLSDFLVGRKVKAIVVACNTATVTCITDLRERFSVPFIGVEPGVKPGLAATRSGVVGVMATSETLKSQAYSRLLQRLGTHGNVVSQECPGLVEKIEAMALSDTETMAMVEHYVAPLLVRGADTIVLGCTHYPFLEPMIRAVAGQGVEIIDTGRAVAAQVATRLAEKGMLSGRAVPGSEMFWTTGSEKVGQVVSHLWGKPVEISRLADVMPAGPEPDRPSPEVAS